MFCNVKLVAKSDLLASGGLKCGFEELFLFSTESYSKRKVQAGLGPVLMKTKSAHDSLRGAILANGVKITSK